MNKKTAELLETIQKGRLFICPTPIGNLQDITIRVIDTLRKVDIIAAEDTRHTRKLLNFYDVKTTLSSLHGHNEKCKKGYFLEKIDGGLNVALVSDAGTPTISDPGYELVKAALEKNILVEALPGPNAAITAISAAGFATDRFLFLGFLPRVKKQQEEILLEFGVLHLMLVMYESPKRLIQTLNNIYSCLGDRNAVVAREISKIHETYYRGKISNILLELDRTEIKGECVLIIDKCDSEEKESVSDDIILRNLKELIEATCNNKTSIAEIANKYNIPKKYVYKLHLESKGQ